MNDVTKWQEKKCNENEPIVQEMKQLYGNVANFIMIGFDASFFLQ